MTAALTKQNPVVIKEEVEDTTRILRIDDAPLRQVNNKFWLAYDVVCAFIVTFFTHPDDMSFLHRLQAVVYIITVGQVMQYLYFNAGLDRPSSGQMLIDKEWHMAIVHFGNTLFLWEWTVAMYRQVLVWSASTSTLPVIIFYAGVSFYFIIWACDVIAGLVHWFGDTTELYFFTYHHKDSRYMTRQSYVHHTWETFALAMVLSYTVAPALRTTLIGLSIRLIASQANECHMWAHCTSREIPPLIKLLQDLTLVLSWRAHNSHHKPPHLKDYCVFNGWANPAMNRILPGPATNALVKLKDTETFQWLKKALDS